MSWQTIVQQKRKSLNDAIPKEWIVPNIKDDMISKGFVNTSKYLDSILPVNETVIINKDLVELSELISLGKLSALEVTTAFCHRAIYAHQILNCCSEIFVNDAIKRAIELDSIFKKTGKTIGILHGIPISLKDQVNLKNIASGIGYVSLSTIKKDNNALIADKLLNLGAILFVKTCVPTGMMAVETVCNIYPYNFNACNINLSSGGSSGGEGSLISAGGARAGFGTDIGGSIRIPAAYNGIYAIKPSVGRLPYLGISNTKIYEGKGSVFSVVGPMAKSLKEVEFLMELIVNTKSWLNDPNVLPIPWNNNLKLNKLKIGFWFDNKSVEPLPPIKRVMNEVFNKLINFNDFQFEVVKIDWPNHEKIIELLYDLDEADASNAILKECQKSGEPLHPLLNFLIEGNRTPISLHKWWDLCSEVDEIKTIFLNFWTQQQLDAIIAPIMPSTSVKPYEKNTLGYTGVCNVCDLSSVVLPLGYVNTEIDVLEERAARNTLEQQIRKQYQDSIEIYDEMPVCLQLITKKLEEEKGLAIAKLVQQACGP